MNTILKLNSILLIGLAPAILCMSLCIFILDAYAIYAVTLLCLLFIVISKISDLFFRPNFIFIHTTIALLICSLVKLTTDNILIPDKAVPLTLQVIIFCFSLLYFTFPSIYKRAYTFIFYKISVLNQIGCHLIIIFTAAYMFLACMIYLFFNPLSIPQLYWLTHIMPIIVYMLCIAANFYTLQYIAKSYKLFPLVRIIPIYNGKIVVTKRIFSIFQENRLDTPIEDFVFSPEGINSKAKRLTELALGIYAHNNEPRFSIKYKLQGKINKEIMLYILPIADISKIRLQGYKLVSPEEIKKDIHNYSYFMEEEIEHLTMVADIWKNNGPYL